MSINSKLWFFAKKLAADGNFAAPISIAQGGTNSTTASAARTALDVPVIADTLSPASNLNDVADAPTSRTNLGLGSAAVLNAGVTANNAVQLDGNAKLPAVDGSQLTNIPVVRVLLDTQVVTNVSSVDFASLITSAYDIYEIQFYNLRPVDANTTLRLRTSGNGGTSYDTGTGNDYSSAVLSMISNTTVSQRLVTTGDNSIILSDGGTDGLNNTVGNEAFGKIIIGNPLSASKTLMRSEVTYVISGDSKHISTSTAAGMRRALAVVDAIRIHMSTGNISTGTFKFYGIK